MRESEEEKRCCDWDRFFLDNVCALNKKYCTTKHEEALS